MKHRYFVILGAMRTGSNLLQETLNTVDGLDCRGELFNPHFVGRPGQTEDTGVSMAQRDRDPLQLVTAVADRPGLNGFRLFNDHDPRVIDHVLGDPTAAKIILRRRPLDSFVSLSIARQTGQWWLGDARQARSALVRFDREPYAYYLEDLSAFHSHISRSLQSTGQTAFHLDYDDLKDPDVMTGLVRWLGAAGTPDLGGVRARVQNPAPLSDRIANPDAARSAVLELSDPDFANATVNEPPRGPDLRAFTAIETPPLLYMPIFGPGQDPVIPWLEELADDAPTTGLTQAALRRWMRARPGHRAVTVVRHPLARAHEAFSSAILPVETPRADIREVLRSTWKMPLPETWPDAGWALEDHRRAFSVFLNFLEANLSGQTALPVDRLWASQSAQLAAFGAVRPADRIIREDELPRALSELAGKDGPAGWPDAEPFALREVITDDIRQISARAYRRDMRTLGFLA